MKPPSDAIIAVTHRCNAHCIMCNVWQSRAPDALRPDHMHKLPAELKTVNLSGGEPFLRKDLPEFVRVIRQRCPKAQIAISTNAYLVERILEMMGPIRRIDPGIHLAVSLDGLGESHDAIRGDRGAFDSALKLIEALADSGFKGLRLGMTLTNRNLDQLLGVAELAGARGVELGVVAAHPAATHLGVEVSPVGPMPEWLAQPFAAIISKWLRAWRPRQWLRAHFAYNTYRYLLGRPWHPRCRAGRDFFFLQADGTVYSCSVSGEPMGKLTEQNWDEIWSGAAAERARSAATACPENCWMLCNARSVYRRSLLPVAWWVVTRKLEAHLRLLRLPKAPVPRPGPD